MNDQCLHRLALPEKMRHQSAVHDVPKDFFAGASLQLHEIEILGNVDVAVDESTGCIGWVELHQLRLLDVVEKELHLALVENRGRIFIGMVPLQALSNPALVRVKIEHIVQEVVDGAPDESEMRVHTGQTDRTTGQKRDEQGNISKDSHIAVLHNVGAFGPLRPDEFGHEPSFQDEPLELFLEAGDVAIGGF